MANAVLDDFGFDPPSRTGGRATSRRRARRRLDARAGFREVRAWPDEVVYAWDAEGYLDFLTQFDEASLFADLERTSAAGSRARSWRACARSRRSS